MFSLAAIVARTAALVLFATVAAIPPASSAVLPDIGARIEQAAGAWRAEVAQQQQVLKLSGDPHMAGIADTMNRQVSASFIAQAVIDAISRNPADAADVTSAAYRAAPELREEITASLSSAFPAFQPTFTTPAPVPVAAAPLPRAGSSEADQVAEEFADPNAGRDPLEGLNRLMFGLNDFLDTWIMVPVAKVYRFIMPETIRVMGRNFFENLGEPVIAVNDLLQGDFSDAGTSVGRFAINSTIGILGFFEVAERVDLKEHNADFGQTLHSYGVGSGPYLVLPLFGPSTVRDAIGKGADSFLNPFAYILDWETQMYLRAAELVVDREEVLDDVAELKKGSLDYYAALRSAWFQKRDVELNKGVPPPLGRKNK